MSFSEFLTASGDEKLSDLIVSGNAAVINVFHDTLSRRLKEYLFVGGMPAAVSAFVQNRSFSAARSEQMEILSDYGRDFGKHAPKEMLPRIRALWRSLPAQLAKEDKRFVAADVIGENGNKMRSRDLKDPFEWLEAAGIVYRVWNVQGRAARREFPTQVPAASSNCGGLRRGAARDTRDTAGER